MNVAKPPAVQARPVRPLHTTKQRPALSSRLLTESVSLCSVMAKSFPFRNRQGQFARYVTQQRATLREQPTTETLVNSKDARAIQILDFEREFELPEGRVVIHALPVSLVEQTAELLATCFIQSVSCLAPYTRYLRRNVVRYVREHQALPPKTAVLVAVLQPSESLAKDNDGDASLRNAADALSGGTAAATAAEPASVLSGSRLRVIGSAEVSFDPSTRSGQPFLDAPERCAYLCNMAVSPVFRRRGVATQLLHAAEELGGQVMREREMYLHLRFVDEEAAKLYDRTGFQRCAQHWWIVPLFGIQRLKLMRKTIAV